MNGEEMKRKNTEYSQQRPYWELTERSCQLMKFEWIMKLRFCTKTIYYCGSEFTLVTTTNTSTHRISADAICELSHFPLIKLKLLLVLLLPVVVDRVVFFSICFLFCFCVKCIFVSVPFHLIHLASGVGHFSFVFVFTYFLDCWHEIFIYIFYWSFRRKNTDNRI